jgi:hypothetical protein
VSVENAGMEMVYHVHVTMETAKANETLENTEPSRVSDAIISTLSRQNCSTGSIVYLVLNGMLVFDRYRDGIVLSDHDEHILFYDGAGSKRRSVSIDEYGDNAGEGSNEEIILHHQRLVMYLPGQVLEYILTFLPDNAVAKLPLVCKSWNNEIGRSSPDLWRHLIDRRGWPNIDVATTDAVASNQTVLCRETFESHYLAVRKLNAVVSGLRMLGIGARCSTTLQGSKKDTAVLHFKDVFGRSASGRTFVRVWSPARALIAHSQDCTLHLFNVVDSSCGTSKRCRQSIRVSVALFRSSKKRGCNLVALDLDDQVVGCLFKVGSEMDPETWLGVVQRDDLLCAGGRGSSVSQLEEGALCSFNLQEKVLHYFLTCNDVEIMGWLYNHVLTGDELDVSAVDVDIKENIVACGNGQFLFEAAIILPVALDEDSVDTDAIASSALVKVFMFSTYVGEITWVGPSGNTQASVTEFLYLLKTSLVSNRIAGPQTAGSPHQGTRAAFVYSTSPEIFTIDVDGSGDVNCKSVSSNRGLAEGMSEENHELWRRNLGSGRVAVLAPSDIVVAECYLVDATGNGAVSICKTVFSFHPSAGSNQERAVEHLTVEGNCLDFPFESLQDDHIVAFCEDYGPSLRTMSDDGSRSLIALLIHVPSREVVHRICIGDVYGSVILKTCYFAQFSFFQNHIQ